MSTQISGTYHRHGEEGLEGFLTGDWAAVRSGDVVGRLCGLSKVRQQILSPRTLPTPSEAPHTINTILRDLQGTRLSLDDGAV